MEKKCWYCGHENLTEAGKCRACGRMPKSDFPLRQQKTSALQLGDHVRMSHMPADEKAAYVVRQIREGVVHLQRPYIHLADFSCTSGVIVYTGTEDFPVEVTSSMLWDVYKRVELK